MTTPKPIQRKVSDEERLGLWAERASVDSFLAEMRLRGAMQIECIRALSDLARLPLAKAKEVVHYSSAWRDTRDASEAFHEQLFEELRANDQEESLPHSFRIAS